MKEIGQGIMKLCSGHERTDLTRVFKFHQNSIKIPKFEIFKKLKFMTHIIIWYWGISVPNMKEIGQVVMKLCSGHGVKDTQTDRHMAIIELPAEAKNIHILMAI